MVTSSSSTLTISEQSTKTQDLRQQSSFQDTTEFLEREYAFVLLAAWKMLRDKTYDSRRDEAQELAQKAFLKYCRIAKSTPVLYPRAYLHKTLYSLRIDDARQQRKLMTLPVDEQGELISGKVINCSSVEDPAEIVLQKLIFKDLLERLIPDVLSLPAGQFNALVCHLKEKIDDPQALTAAFKRHGVDIEEITWPTDKKALQSSRTLLCIAQKKMRLMRSAYAHLL